MQDDNGWNEWSKYVLKELTRLGECYEKMDVKIGEIQREISGLKVKAGVWGLAAGMIPVVILIVVVTVRYYIHRQTAGF